MIAAPRLYEFLRQNEVGFFTGVPDSLLKDFLKYLQDQEAADKHIITANEGLAIGLAAGHYFNTGKLSLVYLQNSGLGNTINPLTSLADKEMYGVPLLMMIGWRGRPGTKDEPQHIKMGRITIPLLEAMEMPMYLLDADEVSCFSKIRSACQQAMNEKRPVALLIPENIFEKYEGSVEQDDYTLQRENVIKKIIAALKGDETVVCTTGKIGREFYEQNIISGKKCKKYLLSAGAMGHANHIALGIKLRSDEKVIMLDGDGAILMHMGSLPAIASNVKNNFIHILINNGSHESVGGQPTAGFVADIALVASACGYKNVVSINNEDELDKWLESGLNDSSLQFVEIRTNRQSRPDLGRPNGQPSEWKEDFMKQTQNKH